MKFFTKSIVLLVIFLLSMNISKAQKVGMFDTNIDYLSGTRAISCFVPGNYDDNKIYKLIIGMHPAQTPPMAMRDMIWQAAEQRDAILVCPDDPQYDGGIVEVAIQWAIENYKIDEGNIVMTGYSAGGRTTMVLGSHNKGIFKGLIGIAPACDASSMNLNNIQSLPIGLIVGTGDHLFSAVQSIKNAVENANGMLKYIEKQGVGHTGQYFWSPEFHTDWLECYDFIQKSSFKVSLESPEDGGSAELPVTLQWAPLQAATSYEVLVSRSEDFSGNTKQFFPTTNSQVVNNLEVGETYYWKVMAKSEDGDSPWSATWSFYVKPPAPTRGPDLYDPDDMSEDVDIPVVFKWELMEGVSKYKIEVWEYVSDNKVLDEELAVEPGQSGIAYEYEAILQSDTEYKWAITAGNETGWGPLSLMRTFTTGSSSITIPTLLQPEDGVTDLAETITFSWQGVENATMYEITIKQAADDSIFKVEGVGSNGEANQSQDISGFDENTEYLWGVKAMIDGSWAPLSEMFSFTTGSFSSVEDINDFSSVEISPNPSSGYVTFSMQIPVSGYYNLRIYNNLGICIHDVAGKYFSRGMHQHTWNGENHASGTYYYSITGNNFSYSGKIILEH